MSPGGPIPCRGDRNPSGVRFTRRPALPSASSLMTSLPIPALILAASVSQEAVVVVSALEEHGLFAVHGRHPTTAHELTFSVDLWDWATVYGRERLKLTCPYFSAEVERAALLPPVEAMTKLDRVWDAELVLSLPSYDVSVSAERGDDISDCHTSDAHFDDDWADSENNEDCYHCNIVGEGGFLEYELAEYFTAFIGQVLALFRSPPAPSHPTPRRER
jgi:hypothetical protein